MNSAQWARVTAFFDEARERAPLDRDAWLRAQCDDEDTRVEVMEMLRAYDDDPAFMEQSPDLSSAVARAVSTGLMGRRLGAYRLVAEIGRGGMGIVYEAQRDDQQLDRRAAIKILPSSSGASLAERFRFERQVLASLDHPGIARLLDAGTTPDGLPYFVMELVDGQRIDDWCRARGLRLRERVALVERVCEALTYAHQHLVIHRDVKPANILVTEDGQPKLLDFGIATMLMGEGEENAGTRRTGQHSFTPEYASPEQVRGDRVTTASDVYSLAVVLYQLLAERAPYAIKGLSPLEAMRTVCDVDPPLMSAVATHDERAHLRGDLDAIVAKALAKAPAERYGTMAELTADLRAWREGRPVSAVATIRRVLRAPLRPAQSRHGRRRRRHCRRHRHRRDRDRVAGARRRARARQGAEPIPSGAGVLAIAAVRRPQRAAIGARRHRGPASAALAGGAVPRRPGRRCGRRRRVEDGAGGRLSPARCGPRRRQHGERRRYRGGRRQLPEGRDARGGGHPRRSARARAVARGARDLLGLVERPRRSRPDRRLRAGASAAGRARAGPRTASLDRPARGDRDRQRRDQHRHQSRRQG